MSFLCASNQSSELHVKLRNSQFLKTKGTSKILELNNSFSEPHETSERQILFLFLMLHRRATHQRQCSQVRVIVGVQPPTKHQENPKVRTELKRLRNNSTGACFSATQDYLETRLSLLRITTSSSSDRQARVCLHEWGYLLIASNKTIIFN